MLLLWCLAIATAPAQTPAPDDFLSRVQADTKWLDGYGTRQIGTAAHAKLQDDLLAKLRQIPGVEVWTDEFEVVVPTDEKTTLQITEGDQKGTHSVHPIWPDGGRLNTTPAGGIEGRFIYIGDAGFERLPARGLHGQIAVMEMSAYEHYRRAFDFGAEAVVFVESDTFGKSLPSQQSLYKPRYYVPAGPVADALRSGKATAGRIVSVGQWKSVKARNIYAAVKPAGDSAANPYAVVAPYDSMSRVLGLAPGADSGLDCAIAINLLRDQAAKPSRPLVFGFIDAYHINQLGMRRMAAMITVTPEGRTRQDYDKIEQAELEEYLADAAELDKLKSPEEGLEQIYHGSSYSRLFRLFKDTLGRDILRLRELQGELRLASLRTDDETSSAARQQVLSSLTKSADWVLRNHRGELTQAQIASAEAANVFAITQMQQSVRLESDGAWDGLPAARDHAKALLEICTAPLRSRNRVMDAVYSQELHVPPDDMPIALLGWQQMVQRVRGQAADQQARIAYFEPLDRLRKQIATYYGLAGDGTDRRVCDFVVGIDISDCGIVVGPGMTCSFNGNEAADKDFIKVLKRVVKRGDIWPAGSPARQHVNINAIVGRVGGTSLGDRALVTSATSSFLLPSVTFLTDDAPRLRVDDPLDRFDQLDWNRIAPQLPATRMFLDWVFTNKDYKPDANSVADAAAKWRVGMGRIVDASAGETVPRVPRSGFLATFTRGVTDKDGIRRLEFAWTGHDGSFRFPLMCADVKDLGSFTTMSLAAFNLNQLGAIVESLTTTVSTVTARLSTDFSLKTAPGEQLPRAVTFECTELNGPSFYDARFLEPLAQGTLLDAVRGGEPKQSHFSIDLNGQMWGLVEPGTRWQLTVRAGASGVRMALLNATQNARQQNIKMSEAFRRGYSVEQELPSIPSELSAKDIYELNNWRLTDFRRAGISSDKINDIRDKTRQALDAASEAAKSDDGAGLHRASVRALASEIRAYSAVSDTGQDIGRGAIFLMLMLVPFAVAMERLVFAFARIGSQIVAAMAIFAGMTLLLWSFHPAFRISTQPLVIVMAFMILAMSVAVISIVLSRFRASMREFQSSLAEGSGARMGRGGLLGSAIFLGIANMRKRKMRTALTGSTLVLVTFALLCFSSASSYIDKKDFRLDNVQAERPSVLVRRPTSGKISWRALDDVDNLLGSSAPKAQARAWLVPSVSDQNFQSWRVWAMNPANAEQFAFRGVLGLPPGEDKLSGIDSVLPDWQRFAKEGGCYLADATAKQMGVKPGDTIVVRGFDLVVRGVYDRIQLEDRIKMLDGQRILPFDYAKQEQDWTNRDSQGAVEQETESAASMQPTNDTDLYLPAPETLIIPAALARELGGELRSIAIPCESSKQASAIANTLMETIVYPAYYANAQGGVNVVVASPLIPVPPRNILVPLIIAALIIFTTMLNSVSERRKEIYVYASLGLAPIHIGALFVAEALTYGLMGAVFGYIAGQGTAAVLTSLGLMQGVTLNYSGTAVINTMLLVQIVVVLAALVPAILAGRIASPSSETDWKVPEPVDGEIVSTLPFTVSPEAAPGLVAFIHEYLEAHRDGVLGKFDVDQISLLPRAGGDYLAGIEAQIWLAPFDVGVRQSMRLTVEPPVDEVCDITVRIRHETGTPKLWWRLNKPFFFELRRQLLGWRKVTPERVEEYIQHMQSMTAVAVEAGR